MVPARRDGGPVTDPRTGVAELLLRLVAGRERPRPHAAGTHQLWTDPHISQGMLDAHLDPVHDRASRRPATIDATVAWLAGWAPAGARILDLGCGPGLYVERLAAAGFDVTGVDFSARSIAYARARPGARYVLGDYREIELDGTFDVILMVYLDFGTHSPANTRRILGRVRRWLVPDGAFVFDVAAPGHRQGSEARRDWGVEDRGFWSAAPHAWLARTLRYDDGPTYLDEHTVITASEVRVYRTWERCFTPESIRADLAEAGFRIRSMHGDLTGTPYDPTTSRTIGFVASPDRRHRDVDGSPRVT